MAFPLLLSTGIKALDIVLAMFSVLLAICTGTYIFTECRFWIQSRGNAGRFQGREPLTLPYSIPWLAGFPRMMNPHAMYEYAIRKAPQNAPVRLPVGPISINILFGDKNIKMIFKNSKILSKEPSSEMLMRSSGMKPEDVNIFAKDTSGIGIIPRTHVPDEKRIWKKTHDTGVSHLSAGPAVNQLTTGFMNKFIEELNKEPKGHSFTVPVWDYVKKAMFIASTNALSGSEIFRVNPDFVKTYWEYDESFLLIAIGLPKLIHWQGRVRRDRMLNSVIRWLKSAYANFDERDKDTEWEPLFGSAYMRNVLADMKNAGVTTEGQAAAIMTIIWAINSNAIPCTVWVLMESLQRPGLLQRLREEIAPVSHTNEKGDLAIDVPKLTSQCPLLMSIYQECLRTRASTTIMRQLKEDLKCDGYILKKGSYMMSPSWLPMHGPLWDVPGHPAKEFWPERFIEMPKLAPKDAEGKSQFEMAMKPDNWFPYGGGAMICTGRFFAKQEIMAAVALLVLKLDFEPKEWIMHGGKKSNRPAGPDESFAGSGILPPDRDLMVTMKRVG